MAADPFKYFRIEAAEILDGLGRGALELERGAAPAEVTPNLLRLAHTLKGAARVVKHLPIAELAHQVEGALLPLREGAGRVEREQVREILRLLDAMAKEVQALGGVAAAEVVAARPPSEDANRTVRAALAELDALVEGLSEAEMRLGAFRSALRGLERARRLGERLANLGEALRPLADELQAILSAVESESEDAVVRLERELHATREDAERLRLVPANTVFSSLERAVRDAGEVTGTSARLRTRGGDERLDAHVLGLVQPALVQLVRNAMAHGIERTEERLAARKPAEGTIDLTVARRGRRVSFTCTDDGRGIDVEAVRRVAEERGVPAADAQRLGAQELLLLLMTSGVSTSRTLTQVAGRGIGLDVVREAAALLDGTVQVHTELGRGTSFELSVPVSVASVEALLVEVGAVQAAIPIEHVRRSVRVEPQHVGRTADGSTIMHEGQAIVLAPLASLLGHAPALRAAPRARGASTAIVIEAAGRCVALSVDRLLGTARVVLRSLPPLAHEDPVVAAASLDAAGDPRLVLDPEALVAAAGHSRAVAPRVATTPAPLLVIDDSLTTRMLEQSILESAGYEVDVASSAEQGLEMARQRRYGVFLVDVEMPGMDGFAFVQQTRADPTLSATPAILVTSRASREDRERGLGAGASAYVVKGEFDQVALLRTIRRLLEER